MTQPVYRWSGEYFGFVLNNWIFDAASRHVGWVHNGKVWQAGTGKYLGELFEGCYVLKNTMLVDPVNRVARVNPVAPVSPVPLADRAGRVQRVNYVDALDGL